MPLHQHHRRWLFPLKVRHDRHAPTPRGISRRAARERKKKAGRAQGLPILQPHLIPTLCSGKIELSPELPR
jgi:hypothetical protein